MTGRRPGSNRGGPDGADRGVSTTLNYVLGLAIALVLITGLLLAGGQFVQTQREQSMESELEVLGEQVSSDVTMADRLVRTTGDNESVVVRRDLPTSVAGSTYSIAVRGGAEPFVVLETTSPQIRVTVPIANETAVAESTATGGPVAVVYTDDGALELESDGR